MTAHVLNWTRPASGPGLLPGGESLAEMIWIAFVAMQALDGTMTFVGMQTFGLSVEAKPLIAWYVSMLGPALALLAVKLFAVGCGVALYLTARHKTIAVLALAYLLAAVGPWTHLLWRTPW